MMERFRSSVMSVGSGRNEYTEHGFRKGRDGYKDGKG